MPETHQHTEVGLPDLRIPVGLFFLVIGLIIFVEGIVAKPISAGVPIDLIWGVVLLIFGALMALFGFKAGSEKIVVDDSEGNPPAA